MQPIHKNEKNFKKLKIPKQTSNAMNMQTMTINF